MSTIQGRAASKGVVEGNVRRCLTPKAAESLREGEILVTSMTTPDFVPYMHGIGGIVTDEGGMLCHAAIVSREFKIPCVVGTKVATAILKTGQRVRVDGATGTVEVL